MNRSETLTLRIAQALHAGECVLLPSDGYYVAAVSAQHPEALAKAKVWGDSKIEGCATAMTLDLQAIHEFGLSPDEEIVALCQKLWPAPLGIVLSSPKALREHTDKNLEWRCPQISFTREVITHLAELESKPAALLTQAARRGSRFFATSGRWLPAALELESMEALVDLCPYVADAGPTRFGCEPSLLKKVSGQWSLVRPGPVSREKLEKVLGQNVPDAGAADAVGLAHCQQVQQHLVNSDPKLPRLKHADAWAIGYGSARSWWHSPEQWIELSENPEAYVAAYVDALHQASSHDAASIFVRLPPGLDPRRLGFDVPPQDTTQQHTG